MPFTLFKALTWGTVAAAVGSACVLAAIGGAFSELPFAESDAASGRAARQSSTDKTSPHRDTRRAQAPLDRGNAVTR